MMFGHTVVAKPEAMRCFIQTHRFPPTINEDDGA
jgi:hypothetical protein